MSSAHQDQWLGGPFQARGQPRQVIEQVLRGEPDFLVGGAQDFGQLGHHGPEVDSVRVGLEHVQREPAGVLAVLVPEGSGSQREVEHPLRAAFQAGIVVELADRRAVEAAGEGQVVEEAIVDRGDVDVLGGCAGA
jgi:hypothetical protein